MKTSWRGVGILEANVACSESKTDCSYDELDAVDREGEQDLSESIGVSGSIGFDTEEVSFE